MVNDKSHQILTLNFDLERYFSIFCEITWCV